MDAGKVPVKLVKVIRVLGRTGMIALLSIPPWHARSTGLVVWEEERVWLIRVLIGSRGGVTQVRVEFMDDTSRSIIRNVKGPGTLPSSASPLLLCTFVQSRASEGMRE